MKMSDELVKKIEKLFQSDVSMKEQLLSGDAFAIQSIGITVSRGIDPAEVIKACETGNIDYLYQKAKEKVAVKELYDELVKWYTDSVLGGLY